MFKISVMTRVGIRYMKDAYVSAGFEYVGESKEGGLIWLEFKDVRKGLSVAG